MHSTSNITRRNGYLTAVIIDRCVPNSVSSDVIIIRLDGMNGKGIIRDDGKDCVQPNELTQ